MLGSRRWAPSEAGPRRREEKAKLGYRWVRERRVEFMARVKLESRRWLGRERVAADRP